LWGPFRTTFGAFRTLAFFGTLRTFRAFDALFARLFGAFGLWLFGAGFAAAWNQWFIARFLEHRLDARYGGRFGFAVGNGDGRGDPISRSPVNRRF
jgi:hypothetical protein